MAFNMIHAKASTQPHAMCFSNGQNESSHTKPRNIGIKGKKEAERWVSSSLEHIISDYLCCALCGTYFMVLFDLTFFGNWTIISATLILCSLFKGRSWRKVPEPSTRAANALGKQFHPASRACIPVTSCPV